MDYIKLIDLYVGRGTKSGVDYQLTSDDYGVTAGFEFWNIADKPQPTIEQLEALQPQIEIEDQYDILTKKLIEYKSAIEYQEFLFKRGKITEETKNARIVQFSNMANQAELDYNNAVGEIT